MVFVICRSNYSKNVLHSCTAGLCAGTLMGITNTLGTLPGFIGPAVVGVLTYRNVSSVSKSSFYNYVSF